MLGLSKIFGTRSPRCMEWEIIWQYIFFRNSTIRNLKFLVDTLNMCTFHRLKHIAHMLSLFAHVTLHTTHVAHMLPFSQLTTHVLVALPFISTVHYPWVHSNELEIFIPPLMLRVIQLIIINVLYGQPLVCGNSLHYIVMIRKLPWFQQSLIDPMVINNTKNMRSILGEVFKKGDPTYMCGTNNELPN